MPEEPRLGPVARRLAAHERVVVVDDDHEHADFLRCYFRSAGYEFVHADPASALGVLDAIDEHRPDCVILGLDGRGVDGSDAHRLLCANERFSDLPVIVMGARTDARQLVSSLRAIDAVVPRPFNVNDLADLVAERIAHTTGMREVLVSEPVADVLVAAVVPAEASLSVAI